MKKTIYLICFSLLGLGAAISCQKENIKTEPTPSQEPIVFGARTPETKGISPLNSLYDIKDQGFSVSAWYSPNETEFGDGSETAYIENHRFGTLEAAITESTVWQGVYKVSETEFKADPVYYPLDGSLSFFSFAPYRELSETSDILLIPDPEETITSRLTSYLPYSPLIRFTPNAIPSSQFDFVAAEAVLNWEKGDGIVPLDFTKHITTRLQFYCDYTGSLNSEEKIIIKNIQIANVIGSEYLFFTKDAEGNLGHQWCSTISPEDGSDSMPLVSYQLTNDPGNNREELQNVYLKAHTTDNPFTWVNNTQDGRMYVLPQVLPPKVEGDPFDRNTDPALYVTYEILNSEGTMIEQNTARYDLRGSLAWEMGKTTAYYLSIGVKERKDLNVISVQIEDWSDSQNQHEPEEILY